jgi:hypothetical protein
MRNVIESFVFHSAEVLDEALKVVPAEQTRGRLGITIVAGGFSDGETMKKGNGKLRRGGKTKKRCSGRP